MARANIELYGETLWISPYVLSSYVALREKRLDFEMREVSLLDLAHRDATYRYRSLTAKVPALVHDGFGLAESSAIAEYLEEAFPPPAHAAILPAGLRERARARQLMAWMRSDLGVLRDERPTTTIFYEPATRPLSENGRADAEKLVQVAEQVVPAAGGALFGAWSIVDTELALMLHRLICSRDDVPARIRDYAVEQWDRPSVREFRDHPRPTPLPSRYWDLPWNIGSAAAPDDRP
jgi:glutathione S-transferase